MMILIKNNASFIACIFLASKKYKSIIKKEKGRE